MRHRVGFQKRAESYGASWAYLILAPSRCRSSAVRRLESMQRFGAPPLTESSWRPCRRVPGRTQTLEIRRHLSPTIGGPSSPGLFFAAGGKPPSSERGRVGPDATVLTQVLLKRADERLVVAFAPDHIEHAQ